MNPGRVPPRGGAWVGNDTEVRSDYYSSPRKPYATPVTRNLNKHFLSVAHFCAC